MTWLYTRLSEASTWAGLSSALLLLMLQLPPAAQPYAVIAAAICAALAVVMREKGTKTPEQIAADAFAAAAAVRGRPPGSVLALAFVLVGLLAFGACSPAQLSSAPGQLFCRIQLAGGGAIIGGLISAAASAALPGAGPLIVLATDSGAAAVNADCDQAARAVAGGVSGQPVSPPAMPAATIQIAAPASNTVPTAALR